MTDSRERMAMLDALRWRMFDALGYVAGILETDDGKEHYILGMPDRTEREWSPGVSFFEMLLSECVPDWPRDVAAALAVCNQIAAEHKWMVATVEATENTHRALFLRIKNDGYNVKGEHFLHTYIEHSEYGATPAEALARLALAAKGAGDA